MSKGGSSVTELANTGLTQKIGTSSNLPYHSSNGFYNKRSPTFKLQEIREPLISMDLQSFNVDKSLPIFKLSEMNNQIPVSSDPFIVELASGDKILLKPFVYKSIAKNTDLCYVLYTKNVKEAYRMIHDPDIELSDKGEGAFFRACSSGFIGIDFVKKILENPKIDKRFLNDPVKEIELCISQSMFFDNPPELTIFLANQIENGMSIGLNGATTPGCSNGMKLFKYFLSDPKCDPSYKNNETIKYARWNIEMLKLLLKDPRLKLNPENITLLYSVNESLVENVKLFLSDGRIDPTIRHFDNETLLDAAIRKGNKEIIELLMNDPRINPEIKSKAKL